MLIKALVENTSKSEHYGHEHGLSLYIEANGQKILFDVGASELFLENAKNMGVNIGDVDILVISHGHYDHGGGLKAFLNENTKAEVFLHPLAFGKYYSNRSDGKSTYIGIDDNLKLNSRLVHTSDMTVIREGIEVFSNIAIREPRPKANLGLQTEINGEMVDDNFLHEQNLVIEEKGKVLLVTGCAHNGIINIVKSFQDIYGRMPDVVIGGFHLYIKSGGKEDDETIDKIGLHLTDTKAKYYTCHCTGIDAYERLKSIMGDRIDYLSTGSEVRI